MRISRRTSGGRGEYEINGVLSNGLRAVDLKDKLLSLDLPSGLLIHTGIRIVNQGGKLRLRRDDAEIQIHRQIAAIYLMPDPARQTSVLGAGEPILQTGVYAVESIEIEKVLFVPPDIGVLSVRKIITLNRSHLADELDLAERTVVLSEVWARRDEFPDEIAASLGEHEQMVRVGRIDLSTQRLAAEIQTLVADRAVDLGLSYSARGDVLPKLADALKFQAPKPALIIDDVDPEDIELRKRTIKEWKRWANARGPASAKFRQEVRKAYRGTCFACGVHFPSTAFNSTPGVDAAHIMPWHEFDLDEVFNGISLCKLHHWAFDESIVAIRCNGGRYFSELPGDVRARILQSDAAFSLDSISMNLGEIPVSRLPTQREHWPHPDLLERLACASGE